MPLFTRRAEYQLQHRYQDSGWETIQEDKYDADALGTAVREAERRSRDSIIWGMVRVIETRSNMVIVEFPAGHPEYRVTVANGQVMLIESDNAIEQQETEMAMRDRLGLDSALSAVSCDTLSCEDIASCGVICGIAPEGWNDYCCAPHPQSRRYDEAWRSSSQSMMYPNVGPVTAQGPDLPAIENRAPRGIKLRGEENVEE